MKNKRTIAIVCILAFTVLTIAAAAIAAAVDSEKTEADITMQPTSTAVQDLITDGNIATSESELSTVEVTDADFAILADMLLDAHWNMTALPTMQFKKHIPLPWAT